MRWYHWITTYMIIIGTVALVGVGADLGPWYLISCVSCIGLGVVGTIYLPGNPSEEVQRAP